MIRVLNDIGTTGVTETIREQLGSLPNPDQLLKMTTNTVPNENLISMNGVVEQINNYYKLKMILLNYNLNNSKMFKFKFWIEIISLTPSWREHWSECLGSYQYRSASTNAIR